MKIKKSKMTKQAMDIANKELIRLEKMGPYSSEAIVSRNYIEWFLDMPWENKTEDNLDINNAKDILNA